MPIQESYTQSSQYQNNGYGGPQIEEVFDQAWPTGTANTYSGPANNLVGNMDLDWDVGGLFMVPANWPMNLPSPCKSINSRPVVLQLTRSPS